MFRINCKKFYLFLILSSLVLNGYGQDVKIYEKNVTIPSYIVEKPDKNPIFYTGRAYQGAQGRVYPYSIIDKITNVKTNKRYRAVYLENDYLELTIMPEIGGRLFSALDKTNGYDFFYRQHVIKPALIGMLGAWISGGVEWNVPHHHRATTFMPVDFTMVENSDGSKTVWVGELELRHRMRWLVGLTLYPDKSYIEVTGKLINRTPLSHSFLYFANIAVHANENYQVLFPPRTEYATYHGKNQFSEWPVSHQKYAGVDYSEGVDVSWWKNYPAPTSFFAWNYEDDFFAGYDHGKDAGVALTADHHIVPGKKLWNWGPNPRGSMWDQILTDEDGPYLELMVGAYSDNQPDYSWCQPYMVKEFKAYWYPIRNIRGVKNANKTAALNLEFLPDNKVFLGLNTTSLQENAKVVLQSNNRILFEEKADIGPDKPFTKEMEISGTINSENSKLILLNSKDEEIISYTPAKKPGEEMPEPVTPPLPPEEIKTNEELYLTGLRLEQFHNANFEPYPYYEEAIRRDPGDYRVNTRIARLYIKRFMFDKAEEHLRKAIKRFTANYTRPINAEANYYLGLVLRYKGKVKEAYDEFYKAAWNYAWHAPAYYQLAELECLKGNYAKALEFLKRSLTTNAANPKALNLKTALLRKSGDSEEAIKIAKNLLLNDPMNFRAMNELLLLNSNISSGELKNKMRDEVQNYIELAVDYGNCGLYDEAIDILSRTQGIKNDFVNSFPLIYYYLGFYFDKTGESDKSLRSYQRAKDLPPDYCFPFRFETIDVLKSAFLKNPYDYRALYYLGNLLYDHQPGNAVREWERSAAIDNNFSLVQRNLGFAYARDQLNIPRAIKCLEKAVSIDKNDPRLYYELDVLYEMGKISPEKRLKLLEDNHSIVNRWDDALTREILLCVQMGKYEKALDLIKGHLFHIWEGGGRIHGIYVDANLLNGIKLMKDNRFNLALDFFNDALEYPENLRVGRPANGGRAPVIYYYMGLAYEGLTQKDKAAECFRKSIDFERGWNEDKFYQGLSMAKLGNIKEAEKIFDGIINFASEKIESGSQDDFFAKFGERESQERRRANYFYLLGLGYLGKAEKKAAISEFEKATALNINHIWANQKLSELKK